MKKNYTGARFKEGDDFKLSFNFEDKKLIISHNGNIAETLALREHESITPAFTIGAIGEEIHIISSFLSCF